MRLKKKKWKLKEVISLQNVEFFLVKAFKKIMQNYSKFVSFPGKIIDVIQSFSFQLIDIMIDYLFKVS